MRVRYDAVAVHGWLLTLFLVTGNLGAAFAGLCYAVACVVAAAL